MSDAKSYSGGCHCGQVRFDVTADLSKVYSCNCSICSKRGALWAFVPPGSFALRAGAEALADYQFNKKGNSPPVLRPMRRWVILAGNRSER